MSSVPVFVGLDYHQAFVQVCVMDATGKLLANGRWPNSAEALVLAVQPYGTTVAAAIESCCGAADLADELVAAGWQVSLAHAAYVHKLKQSPDKTDWSDARLLADLLRVGYLPKTWLPPAPLRQLRHPSFRGGWWCICVNSRRRPGVRRSSGCGRCCGPSGSSSREAAGAKPGSPRSATARTLVSRGVGS